MSINRVWIRHNFGINYETLDDAISRLQEIRNHIPEEYRKTATIESAYGDDYFEQWVGYYRPENQEEKKARLAREAKDKEYLLQRIKKDLYKLTLEERKALGL